MRFALDVAQAKDFSFRNPGEMGRFKPSFSRFAPFLVALLRAQDGLLPSKDSKRSFKGAPCGRRRYPLDG